MVPYTLGGTAVAGVDFTGLTNGNLSIPPGARQASLSLRVKHNTAVTGDRLLTVTLGKAAGVMVRFSPTFTLVIQDAEAQHSFLPILQANDSLSEAGHP
jgi:hypothetical protein